ncbi:ATP-binding protein [Escherichia coli]
MDKKLKAMAQQFGGLTTTGQKCPNCGDDLYIWKTKNRDGTSRCGPTCIKKECGYREMVNKNEREAIKKANEARKQDAINRLLNSSLVTDQGIWERSFSNYKVVDAETDNIKKMAEKWAKEIINGSKIHAVITGKPGSGKTHLSAAVIKEVMTQSDYKISCSFISYRELLEQLKFAMNDPEVRKAITGTLMSEIKKSDFVVIDDLGAELGRMEENNQATSYDVDVLTSLTEARLSKATIFTTNLSSKQLIHAYGERVFSRVMEGTKGNIAVFKNTTDKRREPV